MPSIDWTFEEDLAIINDYFDMLIHTSQRIELTGESLRKKL